MRAQPLDNRGLPGMGGAVEDLVEQEAAEARVAAERAEAPCWEMDGGRLAVVGDTSPAQIAAKLDKMFADWKGSGSKPPDLPMRGLIGETRIYLIHRPNSVQTTFDIGNYAIDRMSPDYMPYRY